MWEDFVKLRGLVPMMGLDTPWGEGTVRDLAAQMIAIAMDGLQSRDIVDEESQATEWIYLAPLTGLVAGAPTQAEHCWNAITAHGRAIRAVFSSKAKSDTRPGQRPGNPDQPPCGAIFPAWRPISGFFDEL